MEGNEENLVKTDKSEDEIRDINLLTEYIEDLKKRQQWREELRKQNSSQANRLDEGQLRKLDSSLKKVKYYITRPVLFFPIKTNFCNIHFSYL